LQIFGTCFCWEFSGIFLHYISRKYFTGNFIYARDRLNVQRLFRLYVVRYFAPFFVNAVEHKGL